MNITPTTADNMAFNTAGTDDNEVSSQRDELHDDNSPQSMQSRGPSDVSSAGRTQAQLITKNGLNEELLKEHNVLIFDHESDVLRKDERAVGDRESTATVSESLVIIVCEASYQQGVVSFIEATQIIVNNGMRGYRVRLSSGAFAMLRARVPSSHRGLAYTTVGFVDNRGAVLTDLRCIVVKDAKEMSRLNMSPQSIQAEDQEPEEGASQDNLLDEESHMVQPQKRRARVSNYNLRNKKRRQIDNDDEVGGPELFTQAPTASSTSKKSEPRRLRKRPARQTIRQDAQMRTRGGASQVTAPLVTQQSPRVPRLRSGSEGVADLLAGTSRDVPIHIKDEDENDEQRVRDNDRSIANNDDASDFARRAERIKRNAEELRSLEALLKKAQDEELAEQERKKVELKAELARYRR